jgi:hypothetical protein
VPRTRITIVVSDHGFALGERGHVKKYVPWRFASRAPFLVHDSRLEASATVFTAQAWTKPVSLLDVFPTLLDGLCTGLTNANNDGTPLDNCRDQGLYLSGRSLWPIVARDANSGAIDTTATVAHGSYYSVRAVYYPNDASSFVKYGPAVDHTECYANSTAQTTPLTGACVEGVTLANGYDHFAALQAVTKFDWWPNKLLLCVAMLAHALLGAGWLLGLGLFVVGRSRCVARANPLWPKGLPPRSRAAAVTVTGRAGEAATAAAIRTQVGLIRALPESHAGFI